MEFIKTHKTGALVVAVGAGVVVAVAAVVALVAKHKGAREELKKAFKPASSSSCPAAAARAKFTTNADPGYGEPADIDGKSDLRGYCKGSPVPIGPLEAFWSASRSTGLLIVDAPKAVDGGELGIREEAELIVVPLPGWEDSNIADLDVPKTNQNMMMSSDDKGSSVCVTLYTKRGKSNTSNLVLSRGGGGGTTFPKGFVVPSINVRLSKARKEEML
jgi:hypothetical protein